MPLPTDANQFLHLLERSQLVESGRLKSALERLESSGGLPKSASALAGALVKLQLITRFHAEQLLAGRHKGFMLGKYRIHSICWAPEVWAGSTSVSIPL